MIVKNIYIAKLSFKHSKTEANIPTFYPLINFHVILLATSCHMV